MISVGITFSIGNKPTNLKQLPFKTFIKGDLFPIKIEFFFPKNFTELMLSFLIMMVFEFTKYINFSVKGLISKKLVDLKKNKIEKEPWLKKILPCLELKNFP